MLIKRLRDLTVASVAAALLAAAGAASGAPSTDDTVLAAYAAYRAGDRAKLERFHADLKGHVLEPYLEYWALQTRLEDKTPEAIHSFLSRHAGSYLADRLRADWLKVLGEQENWARFDVELAPLILERREVRCYAWSARLARGDRSALGEGIQRWLDPRDLKDGCDAFADRMQAAGILTPALIWERARRLVERRHVSEANRALARLPKGETPSASLVALAARDPKSLLARLAKNGLRKSERELATLAMLRLAAVDPDEAAERLSALGAAWPEAERETLWARIGYQGARQHHPQALAWFARSDPVALTEEQRLWLIRAALRAGDWTIVRDAIDRLSREAHRDPAWTYWYGRALDALGNPEGARAHFLKIAGEPEFYGLLATEALGEFSVLPPPARAPSAAELQAAARVPGLARALELYRLDLRSEATREWVYTIRLMSDRQLLAAAELARRAEIWDRAINTADRTLVEHDFRLRYLAPYRAQFAAAARAQGLDENWVLGLVRQESRFIVDANSSAGARGLMQLMPRTARWMARKIKLENYSSRRIAEPETNIRLGTGYLQLVYEDLGHPVLASAAYNAGPGRARRWRDVKPLEGAIYAETIQFDETRDYVKKVMANTVLYTLVEGRPRSLRELISTVPAKVDGERANRELP